MTQKNFALPDEGAEHGSMIDIMVKIMKIPLFLFAEKIN